MIVTNPKVGRVWLKALQARKSVNFEIVRGRDKIDCTLYDVPIAITPLSLLEQKGAGEYRLEPVRIIIQNPKEITCEN